MIRYGLLICLLALCVSAQPWRFEVASVKPQESGDDRVEVRPSPGGFAANGVPLRLLIQIAYGLKEFQITGGPAWVAEARYNVLAKAAVGRDLTREQQQQMLQALLADRFQLQTHRETRLLPALALVVNKGGPKLTPSSDAPARPAKGEESPFSGKGSGPMISAGNGFVMGKGITMRELADAMGMQSDRTVVDRTGISGAFDVTLKWNPDVADPTGVALGTAIREQLGLRLESSKADVEILVIDSAEKATGN